MWRGGVTCANPLPLPAATPRPPPPATPPKECCLIAPVPHFGKVVLAVQQLFQDVRVDRHNQVRHGGCVIAHGRRLQAAPDVVRDGHAQAHSIPPVGLGKGGWGGGGVGGAGDVHGPPSSRALPFGPPAAQNPGPPPPAATDLEVGPEQVVIHVERKLGWRGGGLERRSNPKSCSYQ